MKKTAVAILLFAAAVSATTAEARKTTPETIYRKGWIDFNKNGRMDPYEDPSRSLDERVEDLLGRMTLEEKSCQLATLYGYGRVLRDSLPTAEWKNEVWKDGIANIDEMLNGVGKSLRTTPHLVSDYTGHVEAKNTIQRWFVEQTRLGIPAEFTNEGIHGLNPRLTPSIPDSQKFRIYISCFTSVAMDNLSRIATTDNRLLRRLTRDYRQRGADALSTLSRWASVRRGEEKHIFPYQENADVMLNSSLFYEISVLRPFAEKILREVPDTVPEYDEAQRMLKFLDNFIPIPPDEIPPTSILREFIGGSSFQY